MTEHACVFICWALMSVFVYVPSVSWSDWVSRVWKLPLSGASQPLKSKPNLISLTLLKLCPEPQPQAWFLVQFSGCSTELGCICCQRRGIISTPLWVCEASMTSLGKERRQEQTCSSQAQVTASADQCGASGQGLLLSQPYPNRKGWSYPLRSPSSSLLWKLPFHGSILPWLNLLGDAWSPHRCKDT